MAEYPFDRIFASADAIKTVADRDGTPFYLYHKQGILDSIRMIHNAFTWMPGYQNYFDIRENNNPEILKLLAQSGTGVCACSYTELLLAKNCGFRGDQLMYEPRHRDSRAEALAKELDAAWMINGINLLPEDLPQRIILHYHPLNEHLNAIQFSSIEKSKNGICSPQIFDVLSDLHRRGVTHLGLSLHVTSYSIKRGFWEKKTEILLSLSNYIKENLGITLWCIYIGEGPGLPYQPRVTAPTIAEEAERVQRLFDARSEGCTITLFTGVNRQLMEQNGLMISKILEQREIYVTYLILDAGISHYLRPALKRAYRHVSVLGKNQIENRKRYFLGGDLPDEFDHPAKKGRMLPKVTPGEYCVFHDVGCGARSMAMLYGCRNLAAEYMVDTDGSIYPIAPGRSEQEVLDFLTAW